MVKDWLIKLLEAAAITVTVAAICQEMEKPAHERTWRGKVGIVPYDFRFPTIERFKESYWNPDDSRIFTPEPWGIGWGLNFNALLEKMRVVGESYLSEDDFLMPTRSLKKILENRPAADKAW